MSKVKDVFLGGAEEKAGKRQERAAETASAKFEQRFGETKQQLLPFIEAGQFGVGEQQRLAPEFERRVGLADVGTRPLVQAGLSAAQQQSALSGALGPEAQRRAFGEFVESPGQQFLREQGLRGISGQAAATGGLGGGERLKELTRFSQGLAQQDFGNQFARLGGIAQRGLGLQQQTLGNLGNVFNQFGALTGTGLSAAATLGGVGQQAAAGQSQAIQEAGEAAAAGTLGKAAAQREFTKDLISGFGQFSDKRLKKNIKPEGTRNGHNIYSWDWNLLANDIGLYGSGYGVLADEVMETMPEAIGERLGFMTVNYEMIGVDNG